MATYSKNSLKILRELHSDLQKVFEEVIKFFDCSLVCGYRGEKDQNEAFAKGFSKVKFPHGAHNKFPSMAVDAYPYPIDLHPKTVREKTLYINRMCFFAGRVLGVADNLYQTGKITHQLKWGADWDSDTELKDHEFLDYPHFQLIE